MKEAAAVYALWWKRLCDAMRDDAIMRQRCDVLERE
jgi:hypothetical protein